eukprot:TRINITY_DN1077_c0_g1_i1.p1 TRINITY_DN1077_c0_g1~~TRINITY_DN1077_c0_g1_i1.p1  ORF type:complete len:2662 (+),score=1026.53 TRINITY_DN1077_c0_g1_i1:314-7987(+)
MDVDDLTEENKALNDELGKVRFQNEKLQEKVEFTAQHEKLRSELQHLIEAKDSLEKQLIVKDSEVSDLRTQNVEFRERTKKLEEQVAELESSNTLLKDEITEYREAQSRIKNQHEADSSKQTMLERQIEAKDKKIDKLLRDFNALSILKVEMGTQHKNLEQQVMDAEHAAERLQKELDEREIIIRDQAHRIEDLETVQNRLKKENEALTRRSSMAEERLLQTIDQFTSEAQKMVEKYDLVMREKEDEVNHLKIIVGQSRERSEKSENELEKYDLVMREKEDEVNHLKIIVGQSRERSEKSENELEKVRSRLGSQLEQLQQEIAELSSENETLKQETHDLEKHRKADPSTPKKKKPSIGERGFVGSDGEIIGVDEYQRLKIDLELLQKKLSTVETQLREKESKMMRMHQRLNDYENGVRGLPEAQREIEYLESQIEFRERDLRELTDRMNSHDEDLQKMKMQLLAVKEKYGEDAVTLDLTKIKTGHDEELDRLRRVKQHNEDEIIRLQEDCKYWKDKARIQILDSENVIPGLEDVEKDDLEIVRFVVDRMLDGEDFAYLMDDEIISKRRQRSRKANMIDKETNTDELATDFGRKGDDRSPSPHLRRLHDRSPSYQRSTLGFDDDGGRAGIPSSRSRQEDEYYKQRIESLQARVDDLVRSNAEKENEVDTLRLRLSHAGERTFLESPRSHSPSAEHQSRMMRSQSFASPRSPRAPLDRLGSPQSVGIPAPGTASGRRVISTTKPEPSPKGSKKKEQQLEVEVPGEAAQVSRRRRLSSLDEKRREAPFASKHATGGPRGRSQSSLPELADHSSEDQDSATTDSEKRRKLSQTQVSATCDDETHSIDVDDKESKGEDSGDEEEQEDEEPEEGTWTEEEDEEGEEEEGSMVGFVSEEDYNHVVEELEETKVRLAEMDEMQKAILGGEEPTRKRIADLTRRVTVLKINELIISKRYSNLNDVLAQTQEEIVRITRERESMDTSHREKIRELETELFESQSQVSILSREMDNMVPSESFGVLVAEQEALTKRVELLREKETEFGTLRMEHMKLREEMAGKSRQISELIAQINVLQAKLDAAEKALEEKEEARGSEEEEPSIEAENRSLQIQLVQSRQTTEMLQRNVEDAHRDVEKYKETVKTLQENEVEISTKYYESLELTKKLQIELQHGLSSEDAASLRRENSVLSQKVATLTSELHRLKLLVESNAHSLLQARDSQKTQDKSTIKEADKIRELIKKGSEAEALIGKLQFEAMQSRMKVVELEKVSEHMKLDHSKSIADVKRLQQQVTHLNVDLMNCRRRLREERIRRKNFDDSAARVEVTRLQQKLDFVESQNAEWMKENEQLRDHIDTLEADFEEMRMRQEEIAAATSEDMKKVGKKEEMSSEILQLKVECMRLTREKGTLEEKRRFYENTSEKKEFRLREMEKNYLLLERKMAEDKEEREKVIEGLEDRLLELQEQTVYSGIVVSAQDQSGRPSIAKGKQVAGETDDSGSTLQISVPELLKQKDARINELKEKVQSLEDENKMLRDHLGVFQAQMAGIRSVPPSDHSRLSTIPGSAPNGSGPLGDDPQVTILQQENSRMAKAAQMMMDGLKKEIQRKDGVIRRCQEQLQREREESLSLQQLHRVKMEELYDKMQKEHEDGVKRLENVLEEIDAHRQKSLQTGIDGQVSLEQLLKDKEHEIIQLTDELSVSRAECDHLKQRAAEHAQELDSLRETVELEKSRNPSTTAKFKIMDLKKKLTDKEKQIGNLEKAVAALREEVLRRSREPAPSSARSKARRLSTSSDSGEIKTSARERKEMMDQLEMLQSRLKEMKHELGSIRKREDSVVKEREVLKGKIGELEHERTVLNDKCAQLAKDLRAAREQIRKHHEANPTQLHQISAKKPVHEDSSVDLEKEIHSLREKIDFISAEKESDKRAFIEEKKAWEIEKAALMKVHHGSYLRPKKSSQSADMVARSHSDPELREILSKKDGFEDDTTTRPRLDEDMIPNSEIVKENEQLRGRIEILEKEIARLQDVCSEIDKADDPEAMRNALARKRWEESKKMQEKISVLKTRLKEKTSFLNSAKEKLADQTRSATILEKEIEELTKQNKQLKKELESLRSFKAEFDTVKEFSGLKKRIFDLENENDRLQHVVEVEKENEIRVLKSKVAEIEVVKQEKEEEEDEEGISGGKTVPKESSSLKDRLLLVENENMELRFEKEHLALKLDRMRRRISELERVHSMMMGDGTSSTAVDGLPEGSRRSVKELERLVNAMKRVIQDQQNEIDQLKKNAVPTTKYMEVVHASKKQKERLQMLEEECSQLREKQQQAGDVHDRSMKMAEMNKQLQKRLKSEQATLEKVEQDLRLLRLEKDQISADAMELRLEVDRLTKKTTGEEIERNEKHKATIARLQEEKLALEDRVVSLVSELKMKEMHFRGHHRVEETTDGEERGDRSVPKEGEVVALQEKLQRLQRERDYLASLSGGRIGREGREREDGEEEEGEEEEQSRRQHVHPLSIDDRKNLEALVHENQILKEENAQLREELDAFDMDFFREIFELKEKYQESVALNKKYETQLQMLR